MPTTPFGYCKREGSSRAASTSAFPSGGGRACRSKRGEEEGPMLLRPFLNDSTSCASYLFGCGTHAKLAVVDPHADLVDDYLATAAALGAPIVPVSGPEGSIKGSIPDPHSRDRKSIRRRKRRRAALLQSPLPDSNRRPPPYHGTSQATGGSRWQRIWLVLAASAPIRVATDCYGLRPRGSIKAPWSVVRVGYACGVCGWRSPIRAPFVALACACDLPPAGRRLPLAGIRCRPAGEAVGGPGR
jgi:hypothetical protein